MAPWVDLDRPRHAHDEGFDLHADVALVAADREGLEKLLRYGARPAIAGERLHLLPDGRVRLQLKRRYHDGTTHLVFQPLAFMERLAALVPRPHKNLIIYSGVLAPNAKLRAKVVVYGAAHDAPAADGEDAAACAHATEPESSAGARPNYSWAELMRRAFEIDVLRCTHCGGRRRMLAAVMNPVAVRAILASLGLPTEVPELLPARASPEPLEWA